MTRRRTLGTIGGAAILAVGAMVLVSRTPEVKVLPEKVLPQVTFAKFRLPCPFTHQSKDDPIVFFGQPGASHDHEFFGNPTTNAFSTYQTMSAAAGTCEIKFGTFDHAPEPGDRAGYWIPRFKISGVLTSPKEGAIAWYSNPTACPSSRVCNGVGDLPVNYTFPRDLRIIAGVSTATSPSSNPLVASENVFWNCYPAKGKVFGGPLNECADKGGSRADVWIRFPSCWVGRGGDPSWKRDVGGWVLDSPNHRDHMAYPTTAGCPASHPIVLPQLHVQVPLDAVNGSTVSFSSGAWYTIHFDFWNVWDQARLEQLTAPSPPLPAPSSSPTPSPSPTCTRRC